MYIFINYNPLDMKKILYLIFSTSFLFLFLTTKAQNSIITDQIELGIIASNEKDPKLRKIAIEKITDQIELGIIASNEEDPKLRKIAIKKMGKSKN